MNFSHSGADHTNQNWWSSLLMKKLTCSQLINILMDPVFSRSAFLPLTFKPWQAEQVQATLGWSDSVFPDTEEWVEATHTKTNKHTNKKTETFCYIKGQPKCEKAKSQVGQRLTIDQRSWQHPEIKPTKSKETKEQNNYPTKTNSEIRD